MNQLKSARSNATRLINESNAILIKADLSTDECRIMEDKLVNARSILNSANHRFMETVAAKDEEKEWMDMFVYDDRIVEALSKLSCVWGRLERAQAAIDNIEVARTSSSAVNAVRPIVNRDRLPKLQLKKFNGELESWLPFWEQFKGAIHENNDLSELEKFSYLQSLLTDKAASSLTGLTPSGSCYANAIKMLEEEYGSSKRLIDNIIRGIMQTTSVKHRNDVKGLRELLNKMTAAMNSLQALEVPPEQYAIMVESKLLKSLPERLRLSYLREDRDSRGSDVGSLTSGVNSVTQVQVSKILNFIKREVVALEQSRDLSGEVRESKHIREPKRESGARLNYAKQRRDYTTSSLFTKVDEKRRDIEPCFFCKRANHVTAECKHELSLDKKKEMLQSENRCFRCTKPFHYAKDCKGFNVKCTKCARKHASTMCNPEYAKSLQQRKAESSPDNKQVERPMLVNSVESKIHVQTGFGKIVNSDNNDSQTVRLMLDGGSNSTFIKERISRLLQLPVVGVNRLSVLHFGCSERPPAQLCQRVKLTLKSVTSDEQVEIIAIEVPETCFDVIPRTTINDQRLYNLELADFPQNLDINEEILDVALLIGADSYWRVATGEIMRLTDDLVAVNTMVGWTVQGPSTQAIGNFSIMSVNSLHAHAVFMRDDNVLDNLWSLESLGIKDARTNEVFTDQYIDRSLAFREGRYEAKLPWAAEDSKLDDNLSTAKARLNALTSRLVRQGRFAEYDAAIKEYVENDVAEEVDENTEPRCSRTYYMPHRAVYREDKDTTKIRIVFDASSSASGQSSLNDMLLPGANLVPDLLSILLNFRRHQIAVIADIEKAFLQIALTEDDRDSHRFLWYVKNIILTYRMKRLTFGVTSSPFILACVLVKHFRKYNSETARKLEESHYVDDVASGGQM